MWLLGEEVSCRNHQDWESQLSIGRKLRNYVTELAMKSKAIFLIKMQKLYNNVDNNKNNVNKPIPKIKSREAHSFEINGHVITAPKDT